MSLSEKTELSVIMPALNEERNVQSAINVTLEGFKSFGIKGEIIVINDGSSDKTEELVRGMIHQDSRISMIKHDVPHGIGASFWDGV
ncbi:MAG: glycosyltransferase, partial [Candidatus Omnitrophota bacterium]